MDAMTNPAAKRMRHNPEEDKDDSANNPESLPFESSTLSHLQYDDSTVQDPTDGDQVAVAHVTATSCNVEPSTCIMTSMKKEEGQQQQQQQQQHMNMEVLEDYHHHYHQQHGNQHHVMNHESHLHQPDCHSDSKVESTTGAIEYSTTTTDPIISFSSSSVPESMPIDGGAEATAMAAAAAAVPVPGGMGLLHDESSDMNATAAAAHHDLVVTPLNMVGSTILSSPPPPHSLEHVHGHANVNVNASVNVNVNVPVHTNYNAHYPHPHDGPSSHPHAPSSSSSDDRASHPSMPPLSNTHNISNVPSHLSTAGQSQLLERPPPRSLNHPSDPVDMMSLESSRPAHTLPSTDPAYRRKDKSLGVLCANFMRRYSKMHTEHGNDPIEVTIDEASHSLMVERRRIYDIINILEAIEVVTRKGKNTYHWHGMSNITSTLRKLQKEAFELFPDDVVHFHMDNAQRDAQHSEPTGFDLLLASAEQVEKPLKKGKEKSLGRLSQKFIMLFLVGNETVTLEDASDKILGKTDLPQAPPDATAEEMLKVRNANNKMIKTKIRRLYDIANIMASVGLIAKLHSENQAMGSAPRAKPMFKWIYPLSAREIMDYVDPSSPQQQQEQQQQTHLQQPQQQLQHQPTHPQQSQADRMLGREMEGINMIKTSEIGMVENPVSLHLQHNHFSYSQLSHDHSHERHEQHHPYHIDTDGNNSLADTATAVVNSVDEQLANETAASSNAFIRNSSVHGNGNMHDIDAAAAAEAAVAAVEEGNIVDETEDYVRDEGYDDEPVTMEENESIAV